MDRFLRVYIISETEEYGKNVILNHIIPNDSASLIKKSCHNSWSMSDNTKYTLISKDKFNILNMCGRRCDQIIFLDEIQKER